MMKRIFAASLALLFAACLSGSSQMTRSDAVVATVDGRLITSADLDSTYRQLEKNYPPATSPELLKTASLDSLISRRLIEIRTDSIKDDLERDFSFRLQRDNELNQSIMKVLFMKEIAPRINIDSAMVQKRYEESRGNYVDPEQVKASTY